MGAELINRIIVYAVVVAFAGLGIFISISPRPVDTMKTAANWSVVDLNMPSDSRHAMVIFRDSNGKILDQFTAIDLPDHAAGVKLYFRGE